MGSHLPDAPDGQKRADCGNRHRQKEGCHLHPIVAHKRRHSERRCGQNTATIALVEIGTHAGHVSHIIANIVGDRSGVTSIVFWNAMFDLANKIRANISRFCEDATANTREECLRACSHAEAEHRDGDLLQRQRLKSKHWHQPVEDEKPEHDVQEPQADNSQPHHSARSKSHDQAFVEGSLGACSRAVACQRCRLHPKPTGQSRKETAGDKCKWHPRALHLEHKR